MKKERIQELRGMYGPEFTSVAREQIHECLDAIEELRELVDIAHDFVVHGGEADWYRKVAKEWLQRAGESLR